MKNLAIEAESHLLAAQEIRHSFHPLSSDLLKMNRLASQGAGLLMRAGLNKEHAVDAATLVVMDKLDIFDAISVAKA